MLKESVKKILDEGFTICDDEYSLCKAELDEEDGGGIEYWIQDTRSLAYCAPEDDGIFNNFDEAYDEFMKLMVTGD